MSRFVMRRRFLTIVFAFIMVIGLSSQVRAETAENSESVELESFVIEESFDEIPTERSEDAVVESVEPVEGESVDGTSEEQPATLEEPTLPQEEVPVTETEIESVVPEAETEVPTEDSVEDPIVDPPNEENPIEVITDGWQFDGTSWSYIKDFVLLKDGWYWLSDMEGNYTWEYFDENGIAQSKDYTENGNVFYSQAGPNEGYLKGWAELDGQWHYYRLTTGSRVSGWQWIDDAWYYFRANGNLVRSEWVWLPLQDGSKSVWKYFNGQGQSIDQYFRQNGNTWLAQAGPRADYFKGWSYRNGYTYYFRETSGSQVFGWQFIDGSWRYFRNTGTMVDSTWAWLPLSDGTSNWKYFNAKGENLVEYYRSGGNAWLSMEGPSKGYAKGWQFLDGKYYYFRPSSGTQVVGRQFIDNNWYYFQEAPTGNPYMVTSTTLYFNGVEHYADSTGIVRRVDACWSYDGKYYRGGYLTVYNSNGALTKTRYVGNDHVLVSLKNQYMWIFKGGKLALATPIIGGKPSTPTITGNFYVEYTYAGGTYLTGADYRSWVEYWIPFSGAYGIHDANWQAASSFGNPQAYLFAGSHGCVNVQPSVMPSVYRLLYGGMPVTVIKEQVLNN